MKINILAAFLWGAFWIYWLATGIKTRSAVKTEKKDDSTLYRLTHTGLVCIGLILLIYRFDVPIIGIELIKSQGIIEIIGLIILILFLIFAIWARLTLGANWSGAIQKVEKQQLIQSGPYRHIRNPIYTGVILGGLGSLLINGRLGALLGLGIFIVMYVIKINKEQGFLINEFGEDYREYIKHSWALFPFIY